MNIKKFLLLLVVAFLAYRFLYQSPEQDFGQYSGPEQRAPRLRGNEIIGRVQVYLSRQSYFAGHGFVLEFNAQSYVVSAAHIVNDLKSVDSVDIVLNSQTLVANAKPALDVRRSTCNMEDAGRDVSFYRFDKSTTRGSLSLATSPAQSGQSVWLMCTEHAGGQKRLLTPAVVTASSNRALKYRFATPIAFQGTSGCPVVDAEMRVVGVNVCGHAEAGVAVPITTIWDSVNSL